jgi:hypothetical protein
MISNLIKTKRINPFKIGFSSEGIFLFVLAFGVFSACRQNPGADPGAVKEELREREIVHLTEGQIAGRAAEMPLMMPLPNHVSSIQELIERDVFSLTC